MTAEKNCVSKRWRKDWWEANLSVWQVPHPGSVILAVGTLEDPNDGRPVYILVFNSCIIPMPRGKNDDSKTCVKTQLLRKCITTYLYKTGYDVQHCILVKLFKHDT